MAEKQKKRIAIACQGGGSHTAFTSGVLQRIMKEKDKDFEIVAISGTSGGALCASLLWYALTGGCEGNGKTDDLAIDLLDKFWKANSVQTPVELFSNNLMMQMTDLTEKFNLPSTEFNPNKFAEMMGGKDLGKETFKKLLCEFIKFDKIDEIVDKFKATNKKNPMKLFLGAVDVLAGNFHLFTHEDLGKQGGKYGAEAIIASACIPTLFTPVELNGTGYWDGLFSENPPVVCLAKEIIDELWIIQINPKIYTHVPKLTADINDRRNELSGNLSLEMALDGIKFINELLAKNAFTAEYVKDKKIKHIDIVDISVNDNIMKSQYGYELSGASKLNRDPKFIQAMSEHGKEQAEQFFASRKKAVEVTAMF